MFLSTNNLNEGAGREQYEDGRKRQLKEGKDPRTVNSNWQNTGTQSHSNARWQKLRK